MRKYGYQSGSCHAVGAVRIPDRPRRIWDPRRSPAAKAAGPLGKGGARERPEFSPSGGNGGKRTLRRRRNEELGIFGVGTGPVLP